METRPVQVHEDMQTEVVMDKSYIRRALHRDICGGLTLLLLLRQRPQPPEGFPIRRALYVLYQSPGCFGRPFPKTSELCAMHNVSPPLRFLQVSKRKKDRAEDRCVVLVCFRVLAFCQVHGVDG